MIVVTGAAGFIGSCIVAEFNKRKQSDLILVDHLADETDHEPDSKRNNLEVKQYISYYEKDEFLRLIERHQIKPPVEAVIHMGACSSTTLQDAPYFQKNNFEYSCKMARWALDHKARFIYASSAATYGDGSIGYNDDERTIRKCAPLNLYGQSKQKFDAWVLDNGLVDQVVGLKFFNVFGPNEYHKGDMRSVIAKAYQRVAQEGKIALFKSYHSQYNDGEQKRDFIYVKDAVNVVMFFLDNPHINGIFNVGTGEARSWNDLAKALFTIVGKKLNIEYIEMPESLRDRYQYFTQAEMSKLRKSGYKKDFTRLEDAVRDYAGYLKSHKYW